jgi:hypothetical protein
MDFFERYKVMVEITQLSFIELQLNEPTTNENQFLVDVCKDKSSPVPREEFQFLHEKFVNNSTMDIILFLRENIKLE